jgi:glutathione S-transferase
MKLYYSHTSPYARKVRLVIAEKGLQTAVQAELIDPFAHNDELLKANPLGRVPTLVLDDGRALYDSQVICGYLDSLRAKPVLIPSRGRARWQVLCRESLADGLIDAAYNIVMEKKRDQGLQSAHWISHWSSEIRRALDAMQASHDEWSDEITLAHLATAAAIGYLNLRMPDILQHGGEGDGHRWSPLLAWYAEFSARPSMQSTIPA